MTGPMRRHCDSELQAPAKTGSSRRPTSSRKSRSEYTGATAFPIRTRLLRGVFMTVAIKLLVLIALYLLFFSPSHRASPDEADVARHILPSG